MTTQELRIIHAALSDDVTGVHRTYTIRSDVNELSTPGWVWACQVRRRAGLKQHGLINQCLFWHIRDEVYRAGCGQDPLKRYM